MILYRITKPEYANDLSGEGAAKYGGRWNPKGIRVVYTACCASLAALEVLAHLLDTQIQPLTLSIIHVNDSASITDAGTIYADNNKNYFSLRHSIAYGEKWALSNNSLLLKVPSVLVPIDTNIIINPAHTEFATVEIVEQMPFTFDSRLM